MTIQFEGIELLLTPEQEKQVVQNRKQSVRSKHLYERVLTIAGFIYRNDGCIYQHPEFNWIAIIEESETCNYHLWACGVDLSPNGAKYFDAYAFLKKARNVIPILRRKHEEKGNQTIIQHFKHE